MKKTLSFDLGFAVSAAVALLMAGQAPAFAGTVPNPASFKAPAVTSSSVKQPVGGVCGDGVVQANRGEQCDDGNRSDYDGCSSSCYLEVKRVVSSRGPSQTRCDSILACFKLRYAAAQFPLETRKNLAQSLLTGSSATFKEIPAETQDELNPLISSLSDLGSVTSSGVAGSSPSGRTIGVGADGRPTVAGGSSGAASQLGDNAQTMLQLAGLAIAGDLNKEVEQNANIQDRGSLPGWHYKTDEEGEGVESTENTSLTVTYPNGAEVTYSEASFQALVTTLLDINGLGKEVDDIDLIFDKAVEIFDDVNKAINNGADEVKIVSKWVDVGNGVSVIGYSVGSIKRDERPDAVAVGPVTPEIQSAAQQLIQYPQGGVKGGQVDPIAMKDVQTTQSPDAAAKPTVSAQQKAQLLNQAKFGSGFAAPISSRNGGGGMPVEIGGRVGTPAFSTTGSPAATGCSAGRPCR